MKRRGREAVTVSVLIGFVLVVLWASYSSTRVGPDMVDFYLKQAPAETGITNVVTAIRTHYRLYGTLLELLVFSTAVLGVAIFGKLEQTRKAPDSTPPESQVIQTSTSLLFPFVIIFGFFLAVNSYLAPGGGFAGGVVAGTSMLLVSIPLGADKLGRKFHEARMVRIEYSMILLVLLIVVAGFLFGAKQVFRGWSTGYAVLVNGIIAIKVFIGTWTILHFFVQHRGEI